MQVHSLHAASRSARSDKRPAPGPAIRHLILTKYNAPMPGVEGRPGLDPDWLALRLSIFGRWPLESVRRQTSRPSGWLLFVDADTPSEYVASLRRLVTDEAEVILVDGPLTDPRIGMYVDAAVPREPGVLLTTRLDSDDALSADHLGRIQAATSSWRGFVNPRSGLQIAGRRCLRTWDTSSPFLTFVEDRDPDRAPVTVFSTAHYLAYDSAPVRQLGGPPAWCQAIHDGNLQNELCGVPVSRRRAAGYMGFDLPELTSRTPTPTHLARAMFNQMRRESTSRIRHIVGRLGAQQTT